VIFVVNRSETDPVELEVPLHSVGYLEVTEHLGLYDDERAAANTAAEPDRVVPRPVDKTRVDNGICTATLPPASWHMIRLSPGGTR
jgi:alpha-N-arabinofuranosidase